MTDTVYLIDTFSLMFQVFHAIPPMTSPAGLPTNAVFGFSRDLMNLLKVHKPTWLICAMESPGPGARDALYPAYKANRSEMPEDLRPQIALLKEVIQAFDIPLIDSAGWEADDVIATLTRQAVEQGFTVCIVTSDKDARQLLGPQVRIYNLRKNTYLNEADLWQDWGVRPDQVVDFQSLVGDAVDNVPGVPLVGPKKAAAMLQAYETLENVLANSEKASGAKLRENLKTFADQAYLSRELVRLNQQLPITFDWEAGRRQQPDISSLKDLFNRFGFRRLVDDIQQFAPIAPAAKPTETVVRKPKPRLRGQLSLFDDEEDGNSADSTAQSFPPTDPTPSSPDLDLLSQETTANSLFPARIERKWELIDSAPKFVTFLEMLKGVSRFCFDLETTHLDSMRAEIVGWAFSWQAGMGYYIPVRGPIGSDLLDPQHVLEALRPIFESSTVQIVNQNLKYDLTVLSRVQLNVASNRLGLDPMIADYLLDAGARSHRLDVLITKYFGLSSIPISSLIGSGKQQKNMIDVPVVQVAEYATEDADLAFRLVELLEERLKTEGLYDLYWNLERPLIAILAEMEQAGIRVNAEELRRQSVDVTKRLDETIAEIYEMAGHQFNIDSPIQLRKVLFEEQHLPVRRKTQTGPSTDQEVLEELALIHPLPAKIIEHRQLSKLKGTYLDTLPELIHPETGRIHCSFNQVVAATGRLSCSEPNLQNIPIRTEDGRAIRRAFIAETGYTLLSVDYSQIELRLAAATAGITALIQAFHDGIDIHALTASQVFGIPLNEMTPDKRRAAKAINFGIIYGISGFGLSKQIGISPSEANEFIRAYLDRFHELRDWMEATKAFAHQHGYVETLFGRRIHINGIQDKNAARRNFAERQAINAPLQGTAADIMKRAMIHMIPALKESKLGARLLLQVHDELVFEVPMTELDSTIQLVKNIMETAPAPAITLRVPLIAEAGHAANWAEAH